MGSRLSSLQLTFILTVIYLAITGNVQPVNILFGFLIGIGISFLVRLEGLEIAWRRLPLALLSALRYVGILLLDMLKSMDNHGELFVHCLDESQSERYIKDVREIRRNLLNNIFE